MATDGLVDQEHCEEEKNGDKMVDTVEKSTIPVQITCPYCIEKGVH